MKRNPILYKTMPFTMILSLSTRCDKFGNVFHVVEFRGKDNSEDYACFRHLSSALDFINSNFK